jgi:hypothetical protein
MISDDVKRAIVAEEVQAIEQKLYRLEIAVKARRIAGYTDEENKQLVVEIEKALRLKGALEQIAPKVN